MRREKAKKRNSLVKRLCATRFGAWYFRVRDGGIVNLLFTVLVPLVTLVDTEWVARGTLGAHIQGNGFFQALGQHFTSYLIAYILLVCIYIFISQLSGSHILAVVAEGLFGIIPASITYFKLFMRGEPFFPWDVYQFDDLMGISGEIQFSVPATLYISIGLYAVLAGLGALARVPAMEDGRRDWLSRGIASGVALACAMGLMFGIFLNQRGSTAVGIIQDMWMQERYYRNHGVITAYLTNLQMLRVSQPEEYSGEKAAAIAGEVAADDRQPLYDASFAASGADVAVPDIIYLMAEGFWDMSALPGITYDRPLLSNYSALCAEGAGGWAYSPSFGGGTCDVEFEALTGFSMEYLPTGSKPFQQYLSEPITSLPWFLKSQGYQTLAIHGYGGRFWNRETAYPNLGIDQFISSEDFVNPALRRGFISDDAMVERIIEAHENRPADAPMFIHAVTMQNHTTYSPSRYPAEDLVKVTNSPGTVTKYVAGQLEDCATGIYEMDAALGKLCAYLRTSSRPTIVVFWGDHLNPMSDGYGIYEKTGYIERGDTAAPQLRTTPLLIWSNFYNKNVDLGVLSTYNIGPVTLDLYGLDKPLMMNFLARQYPYLHGRTKGTIIQPDNSYGQKLTERQRQFFEQHAILQYDYMFGDKVLENYIV